MRMSSKDNKNQCKLKIKNQRGLHARASAKFVATAIKFNAKVTVSKDGSTVCGTSIMGLMMLAAGLGDEILLKVEGAQKTALLSALILLVEDKFNEKN
jgi:phosphocarrier protein HPr